MSVANPTFRDVNVLPAIELGTAVILDGEHEGLVVGRGFDMRGEESVYDVRLQTKKMVLNVDAKRIKIIGPCRRDVIGRDLPHNPKRSKQVETESERHAA